MIKPFAFDRALLPRAAGAGIAFDRASARTYDQDGHLHVVAAPISMANVCPYYGSEIPDWQALGLQADRLYQLLRHPIELAKAAASFNGKPLLNVHRPITAEDHEHSIVAGSVSNPVWDAPYLRADLSIWDGASIKAIEQQTQRELSSAYRYRCDMTPGTYQGTAYDGVMRDLVANHVALVREGRAGPTVIVADAQIVPPKPAAANPWRGFDSFKRTTTQTEDRMGPADMEVILKFLVSKLPEDQLAELDSMLDPDGGRAAGNIDPGMSMDSASMKRRDWLGMGARARNAVRGGRRNQHAADSAAAKSFAERFPHASRLK